MPTRPLDTEFRPIHWVMLGFFILCGTGPLLGLCERVKVSRQRLVSPPAPA